MSAAPVRPRLVWSGLLVVILAMTVLAGADLSGSGSAGVLGAALFLAGAAVSVRGGVLRDFRAHTSLGAELADAFAGRVRPPGPADQMVTDPSSRADARTTAARRTRVVHRRAAAPRPPVDGRVGGPLLLAVTVLVLMAQGTLFPLGATGQDHGTRALGLSVLTGLCGLRIGWAPGRQHRIAASVAAVAGLGLVTSALVGDHPSAVVPWFTGTCGVLVVVAAAVGRTTGRD